MNKKEQDEIESIRKELHFVSTRLWKLSHKRDSAFQPAVEADANQKCLGCVYPSRWLFNRNQAKINKSTA